MPNLSTDGQENATFGAKNTNPHAAIPSSANDINRHLKSFFSGTKCNFIDIWVQIYLFTYFKGGKEHDEQHEAVLLRRQQHRRRTTLLDLRQSAHGREG